MSACGLPVAPGFAGIRRSRCQSRSCRIVELSDRQSRADDSTSKPAKQNIQNKQPGLCLVIYLPRASASSPHIHTRWLCMHWRRTTGFSMYILLSALEFLFFEVPD